MLVFFKKKINNKNLLQKPTNGGIPAKDNKLIITNKEIESTKFILLRSVKVLTYLRSKRKNKLQILYNNMMYISMLTVITPKKYSEKLIKNILLSI
jgi:hypothetical protein